MLEIYNMKTIHMSSPYNLSFWGCKFMAFRIQGKYSFLDLCMQLLVQDKAAAALLGEHEGDNKTSLHLSEGTIELLINMKNRHSYNLGKTIATQDLGCDTTKFMQQWMQYQTQCR